MKQLVQLAMKLAPSADLETLLDAKHEDTEQALAQRVINHLDGRCLPYGVSITGMRTCQILVEYAKSILDKHNNDAATNIAQLRNECLNETDIGVHHTNYDLLRNVASFKDFCNTILNQPNHSNQPDPVAETTEFRQNVFGMNR